MALFTKDSGVLLHPTSLPGPYGIGEIGPEALRWVEVLAQMGQSLWQILPLNPVGPGYAPYQARSTFASDTRLISLELLARDGLLTSQELGSVQQASVGAPLDFARVERERMPLLQAAARRFVERGLAQAPEFLAYQEENASWLTDYAEFSAIREAQGGRSWLDWPTALRDRLPGALRDVRQTLQAQILAEVVLQYLFEVQWRQVRAAANSRGIRIIGDVPIFVALDSADVWANPNLFLLNEQGQPDVIAGVPPDYFSATGQRWGNPLYDWPLHESTGFQWWLDRLARLFCQVDVVRIDHFRGFAQYWEIPATEPTAIHGRWVDAPGDALFTAVKGRFGQEPPIIAEDLGLITPDVIALRQRYGFPGMRVMQFSFGGEEKDLPHNFPKDCVAYTATHDNDTTVGWYTEPADRDPNRPAEEILGERDRVRRYLSTDGSDIQWTCIRALSALDVSAVIFPVQDILGQSSDRRMNIPGTMGGINWAYRMAWEELTPTMVERTAHIARETRRGTFAR